MPIKPENLARYPANWPEIRAAILERAGHCCERCKVANHVRIARGAGKDLGAYMTDDADVFDADTGEYLGRCRMTEFNVLKMVDIVLTVAHLDHTPENCDPSNMLALCQRCHLRNDIEHHKLTARATRRARLNNLELPL